jgi:hypothetical protein
MEVFKSGSYVVNKFVQFGHLTNEGAEKKGLILIMIL